jgi:thiol:disulfide interchange protein
MAEKDDTPHNKPGFKSSEFWLNLLALALAFFLSSGVLPEGSTMLKMTVLVAAFVSSIGYTWNRTNLKRDNLQSSVMATLAAAAQMAADALGSTVADKTGSLTAGLTSVAKKKPSQEVPPRVD